MSTLLPFVALMSVAKERRRRLLPLALPAMAGMPPAQSGALAVVAADSAVRREKNVAGARATNAVTAVLTAAVDHGAELDADDLKHIPLATEVLAANPDILARRSLRGASQGDLRRALAVIQEALDDGDGDGDGAEAKGSAKPSSRTGTSSEPAGKSS